MQYTRNMVTGATTADAVVVLIDGRKGVLEQTRRHLAVIALLRVPHVIVAVNKIDLLGYAQDAFARVAAQVEAVTAELGIDDVHVLPVSALEGDNIVERSEHTPWYDGPALLELLEALPGQDELESALDAFRLPVQLVLRPQGGLSPEVADEDAEALRDFRASAGRIASGTVRVGDAVADLPVRHPHHRRRRSRSQGSRSTQAAAPQSVSLQLADDVDAARGAVIAAAGTLPTARREIDAELFQLDARPLIDRCARARQARHRDRAGRRRSDRFAIRPRHARPRAGRRARGERHRPRPPAPGRRPPARAVQREPRGRLVPGHPPVRRRDTRRRHHARLTRRATAHRQHHPTEGGDTVNNIRTATTITTLGLVAMMMAGCASAAGAPQRRSRTTPRSTELRLGYFANVTHAPALVGLEEGLFEDALGDVEVTTQVFNAGPAAIEALSAGAIDATYIGPNPSINTFIQSGGESAHIDRRARPPAAPRSWCARASTAPHDLDGHDARDARSSATRRMSRCAPGWPTRASRPTPPAAAT